MKKWVGLWAVIHCLGCAFSPDQCVLDADCPDDQTCELRTEVFRCVAEDETGPDPDPDPTDEPDMPGPDDPEDTPPDIVINNVDGPDGGSLPVCDRRCDDDGRINDRPSTATLISEELGCVRNGDLVTGPLTQDATLCEDDTDWFALELTGCRGRSFILNADITPLSACGLQGWDVVGEDWSCDSEFVSCTSNAFGYRVRLLYSDGVLSEDTFRLGVRSFGASFGFRVTLSAEY